MSAQSPREPLRILLVDDDPDFLLQHKMLLESKGYETAQAQTREDAIALLDETHIDAVIVDLMLQESDDGFVICYEAKKRSAKRPVILVTGVASQTGIEFDAATHEERSWVKADVVLEKPVRPEQLMQILTRLLGD
jgi:two-component system alkaline phosphatase synthesis response regulator PhoP